MDVENRRGQEMQLLNKVKYTSMRLAAFRLVKATTGSVCAINRQYTAVVQPGEGWASVSYLSGGVSFGKTGIEGSDPGTISG